MRQKTLQFDAGLCRHFFHGRAEAETKNIFSRRGYLTRLFQRGKAGHFFVTSNGPGAPWMKRFDRAASSRTIQRLG